MAPRAPSRPAAAAIRRTRPRATGQDAPVGRRGGHAPVQARANTFPWARFGSAPLRSSTSGRRARGSASACSQQPVVGPLAGAPIPRSTTIGASSRLDRGPAGRATGRQAQGRPWSSTLVVWRARRSDQAAPGPVPAWASTSRRAAAGPWAVGLPRARWHAGAPGWRRAPPCRPSRTRSAAEYARRGVGAVPQACPAADGDELDEVLAKDIAGGAAAISSRNRPSAGPL